MWRLASYQESYWSWFSGVVDCALYPVLFYSAAVGLFGAGTLALVASANGLEWSNLNVMADSVLDAAESASGVSAGVSANATLVAVNLQETNLQQGMVWFCIFCFLWACARLNVSLNV